MKRKLLFGLALLVCGGGNLWAQTDVTSTYLTNADFSQDTALEGDLFGYSDNGTPCHFQTVDGWTSVVTATNNNGKDNAGGYAGGVFAYGATGKLQGNKVTPPSTDSDGNAGQCLGFFAVWAAGGYYYQDVTLAAGKYTLTFPIYCASGTQANTTYTGFFPTSGTDRTVAINTTVGSWVNQTVTFTLAAETAGQIRIGYKSTGNGSGANPMLFFDGVKIEYTAIVVKTVLSAAITAATSANAVLGTLGDAISTAQAVYDNEDATQEQVNDAAATLNAKVELAMSEAGDVTGMFLTNAGFESCTETTTNAAAGENAAPLDIAGDWTQASSAAWSSSAVVAYGGSGQLNGVSAPSADNAGNSGKTLGVSVGWGGLVTYQSAAVTLPAGVYTLKVNAYNNLSGVTQFTSKFGFVPTDGTATLSTKTSFAYATWETDQVTFTLNDATEGKIQVGGQAISGGSGSNAKVFFDNITITYKSFLAGAKEAWDEAVAAAEQAKTDNPAVTGEELTALNAELAKAEPTTVDDYNSATAALEAATSTLVSAAASYNALATVNGYITSAGTLKYADADKKPSADVTATSASDATTKTASQYTALRAYYESNALAEGVDGAVNYTSSITNANNPTDNNGWTWTGSKNNPASNEPWTDADGTNTHSYFDGGNWGGTAWTTTMEQNVQIPAGKYLLTAKGRAMTSTTLTLSVGEDNVALPNIGSTGNVFDRGWGDASLEFTTDGTGITIKVTATAEPIHEWFSVSDFRLVQLELNNDAYAGETEYTALNSAISAAEAKTLGFEDGQYAPYNNVAALEALAAATAIDQTAELTNLKTDVTAATEALTSATWTANDGDVDAIYNGTFAEANGNNPKGWTRSNNAWGQQQTGLSAETNAVNEGTTTAWYYNTNGAWVYGNDGVYTMPLAAEQLYKLTFKYRKHGTDNNNWMKASVLNSENKGLEAVQYPAAADGTKFQTVVAYFKTDAAGNYELQIEQNGNAHLTDVSLVKADAADLEIAAMPANYTYYQELTLDRTFSADKWNTLCVPFDFAASSFDAVKVLSSVAEAGEDVSMKFIDAEGTVAAGTPCLVKDGSLTATNVALDPAATAGKSEATVGNTTVTYQGTYAGTTLTVANSNAWVVSNNNLYNVTSDVTVGAFRAYFTVETSGDVKSLSFDFGGETAIQGVEADGMSRAAIFNLAGQRVKNAQKGIYIVNGKKVLVK